MKTKLKQCALYFLAALTAIIVNNIANFVVNKIWSEQKIVKKEIIEIIDNEH
jgi:putative flippase GtrA